MLLLKFKLDEPATNADVLMLFAADSVVLDAFDRGLLDCTCDEENACDCDCDGMDMVELSVLSRLFSMSPLESAR